jgi:hypothetical protein
MNLPFLTILLLLVLMFTRKTLGINNNYTGVIVIIVILLYMSYNVSEFFSTTTSAKLDIDEELKRLKKFNSSFF